MGTIYIREQGAVVRSDGEKLRITHLNKVLETIPLIHVDQLALMGNIQLTTPAAAKLMQHGIDVVYLSKYGKFRGRLTRDEFKMAVLRQAQMRKAVDEKITLSVSKEIVKAKISNQRVVVQRRAERIPKAKQALSGMMDMGKRAALANNLDQLRGFEGKAAVYYFQALRAIIPQDWGFTTRIYHPPPDPANATLSFGYTLLLKDVTAAIQMCGLDPYIGFFHALENGRPALVLDLMEEFRPVIVDSAFLDIVANKRLSPGDFVISANKSRPCLLGEAGLRVVVDAYEQRLSTQTYHPLAQGQSTYRRCIELQSRQMARFIRGEQAAYQPLTIK